ncbi:MAG: heme-binding protein [Acetobacteraceae bacterium]|nr:heme-binding protein [Acetobacteraceae bacterium]
MWSNIAYYATLGFESLVGIFGIRLYEEPRYDIVARIGDSVEIRRYAPRLAAEVELPGVGQASRDQAFRLLFAYISGANQAQNGGSAKIGMTVPVEVRNSEKLAMTAPVLVSETNDMVRMVFYLPANISADAAPQPTDGRTRIVTVPSETIATLRFSGSADDSGARQKELIDSLKGSRWNPTGAPYMLGYDPPFALPFLRRNEAAVLVVETR